jgi:hypothetical protein
MYQKRAGRARIKGPYSLLLIHHPCNCISLLLPKNCFGVLAVFGPALRQYREHGRVSAPDSETAVTSLPILIVDTHADLQLIAIPVGGKVRFAGSFNPQEYVRMGLEQSEWRRARKDLHRPIAIYLGAARDAGQHDFDSKGHDKTYIAIRAALVIKPHSFHHAAVDRRKSDFDRSRARTVE